MRVTLWVLEVRWLVTIQLAAKAPTITASTIVRSDKWATELRNHADTAAATVTASMKRARRGRRWVREAATCAFIVI